MKNKNKLDYYDIQGNIMINYAEHGFLKARYIFFYVDDVYQGRDFIKRVAPLITPVSSWLAEDGSIRNAVAVATNISFSYEGLKRLGLPVLTLQSFPQEFIMGMRHQRKILGDDQQSGPEHWDEAWSKETHIFISIDAPDEQTRETQTKRILDMKKDFDKVTIRTGHGHFEGDSESLYQDASTLYDHRGFPTNKEHFGYSDGFSNPFFKGMTNDMGELCGNGKRVGYGNPEDEKNWAPLETGEFILGYEDEAQEYPFAPTPPLMGRNGSFLAYNKFHEHVDRFDRFLESEGRKYPGGKEELAAKFVGRWRNGAPISSFPNQADADAIAKARSDAQAAIFAARRAKDPIAEKKAQEQFRAVHKKFVAFDYDKDLEGSRCPIGAHMRRANSRGGLEFGKQDAFGGNPSALDNRRRMIRRGLPYGVATDRTKPGLQGTIIMTIVASIKRQFEFVVQQWLNYGNDFRLANDKDPIMGNHSITENPNGGRMIIEGKKGEREPYFLSGLPRFVETRGGEYFFVPSVTALRMIAEGIVDPT